MVLQPSQPPSDAKTCVHKDPTTSRGCRMPVATGQTLCGAHSPTAIPCPKCTTPIPTHSLARHLSKPLCPVEKQRLTALNSPYYRQNTNIPHPPEPAPSVTPDIAAINTILSRLLPHKHNATMSKPLPENDHIRQAWSDQRDHSLKMEPKHFEQIATLSSLLLTPSPSNKTHIIELAAGRGYTSLYLAHVLNLRNISCTVVTVDRAANRHKADRTLRAWAAEPNHSLLSFQRLRVDLAHLHLAGIPALTDGDVRIIAKHACGSALDLALVAATKFATVCKGNVQLVLASCCRNRCSYHAFGNSGDIWQSWGVSEEQFGQICKAALWGLDENHGKEKASIGGSCRFLIDHARVKWLRRVGWDAHVTTYTEASPENACIVAFWRGLLANTTEQKHQ